MSALFKLLFICTIILPPKSFNKLKTNLTLPIIPNNSQQKSARRNCDLRENTIPMKHIAITKYQRISFYITKPIPI